MILSLLVVSYREALYNFKYITSPEGGPSGCVIALRFARISARPWVRLVEARSESCNPKHHLSFVRYLTHATAGGKLGIQDYASAIFE